MSRILSLLVILILLVGVNGAEAAKRVALVIGNSAYEHATPLANPKNDASDMTKKLEDMGFEVTSGLDLDLTAMRKTVRKFVRSLDGAEVALFFYAGHGLQVNGSNYMAPIDAQLARYDDLDFEALPMDLVLASMERNTKVNLVFLDACRDNPLARNLARSMGTRSGSVGRGLAKLGSGVGSLISFATQPGNVALDGNGRNSPFTTALLKHLGTPGQDIMRDLVYVRRDVLEQTKGKQVPWDNSSLTGEVILVPKSEEQKPAKVQSEKTPTIENTNSQLELAYWNSIKDLDDKSFFEAYLNQFPTGVFAGLAKLKISLIEKRLSAEQQAADAARQKTDEEAKKAEQQRLAALEAEITKKAAEARKAEEQRLAQELEQAEFAARREAEQLKAETAAKLKAAEAARLAAEKRLAELEADRNQREAITERTRQELVSADAENSNPEETQMAALEQPAIEPEVEKIDPRKDRELVRSIQAELNRVGCSAGKADGVWGRNTSRAIGNYAKHNNKKLASLDPSSDLLNDIKTQKVRICPLVCGRNQEEKNGRCVTIQKQASVPTTTKKSNTTTNKNSSNSSRSSASSSTKTASTSGKTCKMCKGRGHAAMTGYQRMCFDSLGWARSKITDCK